jgi:hypothetical protein
MHKGSLPQPDDRENQCRPGIYEGTGHDIWKVLWRPKGQKHWCCENSISGVLTAKAIERAKKLAGHEVYRYRR